MNVKLKLMLMTLNWRVVELERLSKRVKKTLIFQIISHCITLTCAFLLYAVSIQLPDTCRLLEELTVGFATKN